MGALSTTTSYAAIDRGRKLTINPIHLVLVNKFPACPGKRVARLRVGCHRRELGTTGTASDREDGAKVRVLALELGHGRQAALLAVDLDVVIGPFVRRLPAGESTDAVKTRQPSSDDQPSRCRPR